MSHAPDAPRRTSRARRAALVLALVVALGACSHQRSVPDSYGETTRTNFIDGCESALTETSGEGEALSADQAGAVCECAYESISVADGGIPFEDFKEINEQQEEDPTRLPDEIATRIESCRSEANLS
jgi:hypothetical protein